MTQDNPLEGEKDQIIAELVESLGEMKELFRFALLSTSPAIAKDGMEFIRKAEAIISKATGGEG